MSDKSSLSVIFAQSGSLNKYVHTYIKSVREGQKFKFSICDFSFHQSGDLKRHIATVHEGKKPFKCSICDSSFTRSGSLKTHISTVHERQKSFKYSICDASFGLSGNPNTHIKTVHEGQEPFDL